MDKLKEFKERIENIVISYDYQEVYGQLYNTTMDYQCEDFFDKVDFYSFFDEIVDYDYAEERAEYELKEGGLIRLYYFLGNANCNNDIFRINGYGNLEDITIEDLKCLKEEILDNINDLLEEVEENENK